MLYFWLPPPCLHLELIYAINSGILPYYIRFSMTPLPLSDADITSGCPLRWQMSRAEHRPRFNIGLSTYSSAVTGRIIGNGSATCSALLYKDIQLWALNFYLLWKANAANCATAGRARLPVSQSGPSPLCCCQALGHFWAAGGEEKEPQRCET